MQSSSSSSEESSFEESEDYDETDDDDEEEESVGGDDDDDDMEKQISLDPASLKHAPVGPPALVRPRFVSRSLPGTATSSPQRGSPLADDGIKKWSNLTQKPQYPAIHHLARRHSVAPTSQFAWQPRLGPGLSRSKSCGDGRSSRPSEEFDILSRRHVINIRHKGGTYMGQPVVSKLSSKEPDDVQPRRRKMEDDQEYNCGALCLFLPAAFSKKKQEAKARRDEKIQAIGNFGEGGDEERRSALLSRAASLEKFECASWASSAVPDDIDEELGGGPINAYFDLPLELIRGGGGGEGDVDTDSPVKTAFVFDGGERKGGLKKSTSRLGPRKSTHELSNRHVRFSTSTALVSYPPSPTSACITPRLLRAKEEFNALLEAQSACINF